MTDPLTALRDAFLAGAAIERDGDHYKIGEKQFPADVQTAYHSNRGKGDLYTLDALVLLLQSQVEQKVKFSDYFKLCRDQSVRKAVAINDLKDVLAFLTGAISESSNIDTAVILQQRGHATDAIEDHQVLESSQDGADAGLDFRAEEIPLSTRDCILQNPKKEFTLALSLFEDVRKDDAHRDSHPTKRSRRSVSDDKNIPEKKGLPIIIVPANLGSVVSTYNAKEFFEEGIWLSSNEKRAALKTMPDTVTISRKSGISGSQVRYEICHDAASLTHEMWRRVVCVIVQGQAWQFKDWKIGKTPQEIFQKVYCCYLHFDDEKPHPNISQWGIKPFSVSKTRRHLTMSVYHTLWQNIENHIASHKSGIVIS